MTRRDFLKVAGAGAGATALLGASGCRLTDDLRKDIGMGGKDMNVVVVILDSVRKDHIGAYGNDGIQTPNLDALTKESLNFTRAYPDSIPTICARRAIHTGIRTWPFRNWHHVRSDFFRMPGWQPIPEDQTTLAEILMDEGYQTTFVTDTVHQFKPFYNMHRGFEVFDFIRGQERDFYQPLSLISENKLNKALKGGGVEQEATDIVRQHFANTRGRQSEEDWFAPQVFSRAMNFMEDAAKGDDPFFMLVDAYDPHEPWDPPQEYISLYDDQDGPSLMSSSSGRSIWLGEKKLKRMHAMYSAELTLADHWLGQFMKKFHDLKLNENTMLVLLSDHGHAFGEHGYAGKVSEALYPELTDIIFMIRHPEGKKAGESSDYYASTHDIAPTVLGALGMKVPDAMDGQNLTALLDGKDPGARPHFSLGYHDHAWARDDDYIMFAKSDGTDPKLFDAKSDPQMNEDIAGDDPETAKRMFNDYILKDAGGPLPQY